MRWSTAADRARDMARNFGVFVADRSYTDPVLSQDPAQLRLIFTEFAEYLRSPAAAAKPDKPLTASAIDATRSQTQVYTPSWSITPLRPPPRQAMSVG